MILILRPDQLNEDLYDNSFFNNIRAELVVKDNCIDGPHGEFEVLYDRQAPHKNGKKLDLFGLHAAIGKAIEESPERQTLVKQYAEDVIASEYYVSVCSNNSKLESDIINIIDVRHMEEVIHHRNALPSHIIFGSMIGVNDEVVNVIRDFKYVGFKVPHGFYFELENENPAYRKFIMSDENYEFLESLMT